MPTKFIGFQQVLEAMQNARMNGAAEVLNDKTTRETDDQDCYPRGIILNLERSDPRWSSIRFLAKHLDWLELDTGKSLTIRSLHPIVFRITELGYLNAVVRSLTESGISCYVDINYH
jgi:hypothetical protein